MRRKEKRNLWIIIITLIVIFSFLIYNNGNPLVVSGTGTYTTTKSCSSFMQGIGNPSSTLPFTWEKDFSGFVCIQSASQIKLPPSKPLEVKYGCKITYSKGYCGINDTPIDTTKYSKFYTQWGVSCDEWVTKETKNFVDSCWKGNTIVNIGEQLRNSINNQFKCVITYKSGCISSTNTNKCNLIYGDGNEKNTNIIIIDDNTKLTIFDQFSVINTIKTQYPFSSYPTKFNIYVSIINITKDSFSNSMNKDAYTFNKCNISNYNRDVIYINRDILYGACGNFGALSSQGCFIGGNCLSLGTISIFWACVNPTVIAHELMHAGGAIGESYGENPQMWTNQSVNNVINWINRK